MGVVLESDKYGVPKGLCFSLPTRCIGGGEYKIVDYDLFEELQKRIG
jgi:malate/lactate dehydrogenase